MSNQGSSACGGGGAGFKGTVAITETADYVVTVGSGGISRARYQSTVDSGGATTISKGGVVVLSAGGGGGGSAWIGGASGGAGGVLSNNFLVVSSEVSTNGNNGYGGNRVSTSGVDGPISGHTWGKSGWSAYGWAGGNVGSSYHGYVMIKYVGPLPDIYTFTINPTPSDATITLTVDGKTYTQSSITVISGKTVSWSVSKSGYTTQTGSNTVTEDTTESITLEELQEPLYYCYVNHGINPNSPLYDYIKTPIGSDRNPHGYIKVYGKNPSTSPASSSSELIGTGYVASDSYVTEEYYRSGSGGEYYYYRDTSLDLYT